MAQFPWISADGICHCFVCRSRRGHLDVVIEETKAKIRAAFRPLPDPPQ